MTDHEVPRFIVSTTWDRLPGDVQERARLCMLDNLGAMLSGLAAPSAAIAAAAADRLWGGDEATVVVDGARASVPGAAFANAVAANGIDIDDCGVYTLGHPGAQVLPAALAVAEHGALPGDALLCATVVGYEVAFRAGRCIHDSEAYYYRSCGSWGSLACAAIAANLLGLSEAKTAHALGIAEYHAPYAPMFRDIDAPAMVKHACGWGAATGLTAATLAAQGFTGCPSIFEDERYRDWVSDIGRPFLITTGVMWKQYSCCAWTHPALDALQQVLLRRPVAAGDVRRIHVTAYRDAVRLGARQPETTEEAQFNLAWPLAARLVDGDVSPAQVLEPRLHDPRLRALAALVEMEESPEFTRLYDLSCDEDPEGADMAQVVLELADGTRLDSGPVRSEVYPDHPWGREELAEKFRWLAAPVLRPAIVDSLIDMVWGFDRVEDSRELISVIDAGLREGQG
jgi:2-methylcitrate dehydratase PrpD